MNLAQSSLISVVEGLTEYLPVSSLGHVVLTEHFLGVSGDEAKTFAIALQFGAIAAVLVAYRVYLWGKVKELFAGNETAKKFFWNLFVSFLPVAVVGFFLGAKIKEELFTPGCIAVALFVGGILMIVIERVLGRKNSVDREYEHMSPMDALKIGCCQVFSLWPGFSRSMSTILGGRIVGLSAPAACEYSFFLALPTLMAASVFEFLKALKHGGENFDASWWISLGIGSVISFVIALIVIRYFIEFLRRYSLEVFGYYRIVLAIFLYVFLK